MSSARLKPGTPCMIRCKSGPLHNGKVVEVVRYLARFKGYVCSPDLEDPADGARIAWTRDSLIPLGNSDEPDEMLRITGKPKEAQEC